MIVAELSARVNPQAGQVPHGELALAVDLKPAVSPSQQLDMTVSIADDAGHVLPTQSQTPVAPSGTDAPLPGMRQVVVLKVYYGGSLLTSVLPEWEIEKGVSATSFRLVLPADAVRSAVGWEVDHSGAPVGGLGEWKIVAEYGPGSLAYNLLEGGIAESSSRRVTATEHLIEISGRGQEICYDRVLIDYQQPAHHGLKPEELIRELLVAIGVPASRIDVPSGLGAARANPVDLGQVSGWQEAQLIAEAFNRRLFFEGTRVVAPRIVPETASEITFTTKDLVAVVGLGDIDTTSERPTCLIVEGQRSERTSPRDGATTTVKTIEVYGPHTIRRAAFQQDLSGNLVAVSGTAPSEQIILLSRVTTYETKVNGCLALRRIETESLNLPTAARYKLDKTQVTPAIGGYPGTKPFVFDSAAVKDDVSPAYRYVREKLELAAVEETEFTRDDQGRLIHRDVRRGRWLHLAAAVKGRASPATAWETLNVGNTFSGDILALADLSVVDEQWADMFDGTNNNTWAEEDSEDIFNTDDNFKQRTSLEQTKYRISEGSTKLFGSGETSDQRTQQYELAEKKQEFYETTGTASHRKVTVETGPDGKLKEGGLTVEEPIEGWPQSDICTEESLDAQESVRFKGEACAPLPSIKPYTEYESNPYLESEDEAAAYAERRLIEEHPITLTFAVPLAGSLRRQMAASVNFEKQGWVGDGWIEELRPLGEAVQGGHQQIVEVTFQLRVI